MAQRIIRGFNMIWSTLAQGVVSLVNNFFKLKQAKAEAEIALQHKLSQTEADWDLVAQQQAQYSWKDEFITFIWFSPLIMAWFEPDRAMKWVEFVEELPYFYQFVMFGIVAATFGLRWYFKQNKFSPRSPK